MSAFFFFSQHMLPVSGGYLDQPNKAIEAIQYLQSLRNKSDDEKIKKTKTSPRGSGKGSPSMRPPVQTFKKGRPAPKHSNVRVPVKRS